MQFAVALLALAATAMAAPTCGKCQEKPDSVENKNVCGSRQTVVCQSQGNGGVVSLGNLLPGLLGDNCSAGDVYCCSHDDVKQVGLINLDLNVQCALNRVL